MDIKNVRTRQNFLPEHGRQNSIYQLIHYLSGLIILYGAQALLFRLKCVCCRPQLDGIKQNVAPGPLRIEPCILATVSLTLLRS